MIGVLPSAGTRLTVYLYVLAIFVFLASQSIGLAQNPARTGFPISVAGDDGIAVALKSAPKRIVSLAPSNTEILFAIGAGDRLVADTESCDYPPAAKRLPHISGFGAGDLEKIEAKFPDLVIAVGTLNKRLIGALRGAHIPTLVLEPRDTNGVLADIRLIGQATGCGEKAAAVVRETRRRLDAVKRAVAGAAPRPRVLILYGVNPIYTSPPDSFIHDLITTAGGQDIIDAPMPQNIISSAAVLQRAPDVIICSPELRNSVRRLPGWDIVPAVKQNRFFSTTGEAELTRPGPRIAAAAEQLARCLYPKRFEMAAPNTKR